MMRLATEAAAADDERFQTTERCRADYPVAIPKGLSYTLAKLQECLNLHYPVKLLR